MARDDEFDEFDDDLEMESPSPVRRRRGSSEPPGFVKAMGIIDLVMCGLRLVVGGFGVIGLLALAQQMGVALSLQMYAEVGVNLLLGVVGIVAAILLLLKSPAAIPAGWAAVALSILSMLLSIPEIFRLISNPDSALAGQAQRPGMVVGAIVGASFTFGIRVLLVGLYIAALQKFSQWLSNRR